MQAAAEGWHIKLVKLYCIVLYLSPVLNPMSYDGARLYKAPGRPIARQVAFGQGGICQCDSKQAAESAAGGCRGVTY